MKSYPILFNKHVVEIFENFVHEGIIDQEFKKKLEDINLIQRAEKEEELYRFFANFIINPNSIREERLNEFNYLKIVSYPHLKCCYVKLVINKQTYNFSFIFHEVGLIEFEMNVRKFISHYSFSLEDISQMNLTIDKEYNLSSCLPTVYHAGLTPNAIFISTLTSKLGIDFLFTTEDKILKITLAETERINIITYDFNTYVNIKDNYNAFCYLNDLTDEQANSINRAIKNITSNNGIVHLKGDIFKKKKCNLFPVDDSYSYQEKAPKITSHILFQRVNGNNWHLDTRLSKREFSFLHWINNYFFNNLKEVVNISINDTVMLFKPDKNCISAEINKPYKVIDVMELPTYEGNYKTRLAVLSDNTVEYLVNFNCLKLLKKHEVENTKENKGERVKKNYYSVNSFISPPEPSLVTNFFKPTTPS